MWYREPRHTVKRAAAFRITRLRVATGSVLLSLTVLGCAESNFELAPESRLPGWLTIPAGLSRSDVTASMQYYTMPYSRVTFKLWDKRGHKLAQKTISYTPLEPVSLGPKTPAGGFDDRSYPLYEVLIDGGITELIEHRKFERFFYITDDPAIKHKLGVDQAIR
jgi:hypothetical protein